jgi:hypothetical protein
MVLFFMWNPIQGLLQHDAAVSKRSYILLRVATLLNALWFVVGWKDGLAMRAQKGHLRISLGQFVIDSQQSELRAGLRRAPGPQHHCSE